MINLSYAITPELKEMLSSIDSLRVKILLLPLSHRRELELRWHSNINRIYWSFVLNGVAVIKSQILKVLIHPKQTKPTHATQEINNFKNTLDYIYLEWVASNKTVSVNTVKVLYNKLSHKPTQSFKQIQVNETPLKQLLDYLQSSPEHPIIQSAIAMIKIIEIKPFKTYNDHIARLLSLLFLYKQGYDIRGLLLPEEYWAQHIHEWKKTITSSIAVGRLTMWLEYFTHSVQIQLQKVYKDILSSNLNKDITDEYSKLNDRQQSILDLLENPKMSITNKKVQQQFNISQITASRDLAKLATLGLLYPHGKGRSVYYTRV